jgi:hypothetical protein
MLRLRHAVAAATIPQGERRLGIGLRLSLGFGLALTLFAGTTV